MAGLVTAGTAEEWFDTVAHWTQALSNVSLVEFVLLAALTTVQWIRHRIRGAGWVALSFAILGALSLTVKIDPGVVSDQTVAKVLIAVLLLMPYCLFRFAASFRTPSPAVRVLSAALTVGIIVFTFALRSIPVVGHPEPPHFLAYRVAFVLAFGFLFSYVVIRLFIAGKGEPPIAATRMRLLAVAVVGLEVPVVVSVFGLGGATVTLVTRGLSVAMGLLLLVALVLPSFVQVLLHRREDEAFRRAIGELVSAGDSRDVAEHLLPHVCALVGASKAALLRDDGTIVARFPARPSGEGPDLWEEDGNDKDPRLQRITVQTKSGTTHALAVKISPYMPYFGSEELSRLDQLTSMVGLAIERCEMAEQMVFQASHDGLTGLANRSLFMERLSEALSRVGRRRSALAVLFIDLDRFKLVNDRADHSAGDLVLNEMADRLTAMTRGVDVVARFGGDEFVALGEVNDERDALDMAERIRAGIGAPLAIGSARVVVTASIGLVVTTDATTAPAAVIRDADNAMYEAKRLGRDQVVLHRVNAPKIANGKRGLRPIRAARLNAGYNQAKTPTTARFEVDAPDRVYAGHALPSLAYSGHDAPVPESNGHADGIEPEPTVAPLRRNAISDPSLRALPKAGIQGTAWIALQSVVFNLSSLVVFVVLGRLLDPREFGLVASASVVVLFLKILVDGGISKHLIQREELTEDLVNSAFWTAVAFGVTLTLILIVAAPLFARLFNEPALTNVVRALSFVVVFASLDRTQSALLDRRMAFRISAFRGSVAAICSAAAAILAAFAGWGVWALVVQTITFEVVNLACLWSLSGWHPRFNFSRHHLAELLPSGGRYLSIVVVQYLNFNVDNLLIGVFLGPIALGYYVVAYRILIVTNDLLVTTMNRVGLAAFSRLQREEEALRRACYTVAGLSAAIALPLYVGLALVAPQMIHILFGEKWEESVPVMQVLCIAGIMQAITSLTHPLVIAIGKVRNELRWNLVACGLYMVAFAASVHFGIVAVAWSIAVVNVVLVPIRLVLIRRWAGVSIRSYFVRLVGPGVATAVMAVCVAAVNRGVSGQGLLVRFASEVAAGAICYLAALFVCDRKTARSFPQMFRSLLGR